jgi:hypothetical protein
VKRAGVSALARYTPAPGETPVPRIPQLWAIRYPKRSSQTVTVLDFREADARDLADEVTARGGDAGRLVRTDLDGTDVGSAPSSPFLPF